MSFAIKTLHREVEASEEEFEAEARFEKEADERGDPPGEFRVRNPARATGLVGELAQIREQLARHGRCCVSSLSGEAIDLAAKPDAGMPPCWVEADPWEVWLVKE